MQRRMFAIAVLTGFFLISCTCNDSDREKPTSVSEGKKEKASKINEQASTRLEKYSLPSMPKAAKGPLKDEDWLTEFAIKEKPVPESIRISPEGVGLWKACMSEEELRKSGRMTICQGSDFVSGSHCYTPFIDSKKAPPVELWAEKRVFRRAVVRDDMFKSPQGMSAGRQVHDIYAYYKNFTYSRARDKSWVVTVPELRTHFYLSNKTAKDPGMFDGRTMVTRMEVIFSCGEGTKAPE